MRESNNGIRKSYRYTTTKQGYVDAKADCEDDVGLSATLATFKEGEDVYNVIADIYSESFACVRKINIRDTIYVQYTYW